MTPNRSKIESGGSENRKMVSKSIPRLKKCGKSAGALLLALLGAQKNWVPMTLKLGTHSFGARFWTKKETKNQARVEKQQFRDLRGWS